MIPILCVALVIAFSIWVVRSTLEVWRQYRFDRDMRLWEEEQRLAREQAAEKEKEKQKAKEKAL